VKDAAIPIEPPNFSQKVKMQKSTSFNAWVSDPEQIVKGVVVRGIMVNEFPVPRFQVVLVLDDSTDLDAVNKNRSTIRDFVKTMESRFGTDLNSRYRGSLYRLLRWHREDGLGWGKLARFMNYLSLVFTFTAYEYYRNSDTKMSNTAQDRLSNPSFLKGKGLSLLFLFLSLGKTITDFDSWMKQGFEYLDENRLSFDLVDQPFPQMLVRDKLRYLQRQIDREDIFISGQDQDWSGLDFEIFLLHQNGSFTKINEVLEDAGLSSWKKNKAWIQRLVLKITQQVEESDDPTTNSLKEMFREKRENA
jgi:hypothetical protein